MDFRAHKSNGLTLIEMTLVIATIALLIGFGVPAVRALVNSFHSEGGVRSVIEAALSSARAMAQQRQCYLGVRFQMAYNRDAADPEDVIAATQYLVFIVHDPDRAPNGTEYANGFRAVEGIEPIKLPETFGVTDLTYVERSGSGSVSISETPFDADIDNPTELRLFPERLRDATTFSVVFSPSGKLVVHEVRVWNRHGRRASDTTLSTDEVFNAPDQVINPNVQAMFYQDDFPSETGLGPEFSRTSFVIFDRARLRSAYQQGAPWTNYLQALAAERMWVGPYTGALISSK
jgi:hypothetical protein